MPHAVAVLRLYKQMLRYSAMFSDYNFREYALARVKESFRDNKSLRERESIEKAVEKAKRNLEMLQRQAQISQMYKGDRLVIEAETPSRSK
eukprot:jgi/Galph1/3572/GphlegSOOS_G2216.1